MTRDEFWQSVLAGIILGMALFGILTLALTVLR